MRQPHDVVIIGGGHNGLTAAAYLASAGKRVLLLERDDHLGGAAVSAEAFDGVDARLSRYSYLVSLLPQRIIDDLALDVQLVRRRYSSYTPDPADPSCGLLIDREAGAEASAAAFADIGAETDAHAWNGFYADTAHVAERLFPTLTEPLPTRAEARALIGDDRVWREFVERPLGEAIEARFESDLVRGVVATDGLIGTFTSLDDPALDANRCFLYHVVGGGTGDWDVPVGGMGRRQRRARPGRPRGRRRTRDGRRGARRRSGRPSAVSPPRRRTRGDRGHPALERRTGRARPAARRRSSGCRGARSTRGSRGIRLDRTS
ncbi:phytoene dehydrogenase-like protein [Agromyces albus]|nr:phytoene dehydrogenase-like protein [Agromyces albus]